MAAPVVFWLDEGYDREHALDRVCRYGAEVRERPAEFAGISPVPFAVAAWRLAASLTPAYIRWHRRVTAPACLASPWGWQPDLRGQRGGALACRAEPEPDVVPRPRLAGLAAAARPVRPAN